MKVGGGISTEEQTPALGYKKVLGILPLAFNSGVNLN